MVQGHFGVKINVLVPNLKRELKNPDFEVRKFFAFSISMAPGLGHKIFLDPNIFECLSHVDA